MKWEWILNLSNIQFSDKMWFFYCLESGAKVEKPENMNTTSHSGKM